MIREYIIKVDDTKADIMGGIPLEEPPKELVRCKDCRFGEEWGRLVGCGSMKGFGITHKPDWFCADGERKDGDGDG